MREYILYPSNKTLKELFDNINEDNIHIIFNEGLYITGCSEIDTLHLKAKNILLEGIGDVVIYDNKGHMINSHPYPNNPSSNAHTLLLEGDRVVVNNITLVNGCNIDFEYKNKMLYKVSDCITQAYAIGVWNTNYFEMNNCKLYSILDTISMKCVEESVLNNCYIQGNNDFLPHAKKSYMNNCVVRNMGPYPVWSTDYLAVYDNVVFNIDSNVNELCFTKRGGNLCFIDCKFNTLLDNISFEIEPNKESRYYIYNTYLNNNKLKPNGFNESFIELSLDDVNKIRNKSVNRLSLGINGNRILEEQLLIKADSSFDSISLSKGLEYSLNDNVITITSNIIGNDKECYIELNRDFISDRFYFLVKGKKIKAPNIIRELEYKIEESRLYIDYEVEEAIDAYDLSYALIYQDDIFLYKINKNQFISLYKADINKQFKIIPVYLTTESKEAIGNAIYTRIINKTDVNNELIINDFEGYQLNSKSHLYMTHIKPLYLGDECPNFVSFDIKPSEPPFTYLMGTDNAKGIKGLLYTSRGAALIYPHNENIAELDLDIFLAVEKSTGEGFGSANGQYLELFMNYDHTAFSGLALRLEREASTDKGVYMSIREYKNGINRIIGDKLFTKKYLTDCHIHAECKNNIMSFSLILNEEVDSLSIPIDSFTSAFMLRGTGTIGIGNRFLVRKINYKYK